MKKLGNFVFWFLTLLVSAVIILSGISSIYNEEFGTKSIVTPLPSLASILGVKGESNNFWQPKLESATSTQKPLNITAISAITYDLTTDRLIYEKESDLQLPMASLTKIMTAIIVLENLDLNEKVVVPRKASEIGEGTMGLSFGEELTREELLYGLLLQSGNDAGETLAMTSGYERDGFLHLMNKKAEDLGLSNTRFTNATGLEGDGKQYSTVKELVVLTKYALTNPTFAKIVATYQHEIPVTSGHKAFILYNETNLLTTYPGVKGVKTGYTDEAGLCLVTYLDYQGHKIIGVLLNSQSRREEMAMLLDYSLKELGVKPPKH